MNANELADEFKEENNDWNEDNLRHWGKQTEAMLRQQQAEIEALKVRLNPYQSITDTKIEPTVVSYTHPVELTELTDGELEAIRKKAWKLADDATGNCISYSLEFQVIYDREFARAILRKAQEK